MQAAARSILTVLQRDPWIQKSVVMELIEVDLRRKAVSVYPKAVDLRVAGWNGQSDCAERRCCM